MARSYVIAIASEKGGVGKTTLATNLAIYLKGLAEDLPVTLFSFDNHFTVDQMFQLSKTVNTQHVGQLFTGSNPADLLSDGQYGVSFVQSSRNLFENQHRVKALTILPEPSLIHHYVDWSSSTPAQHSISTPEMHSTPPIALSSR